MGERSSIEWTNSTWTPIRARYPRAVRDKIGWHCEHVSEGCRNCYAEGINKRFGTGLDFKPGHRKDINIFLDEQMLLAPLRWKKPKMIFVCSMSDLFAEFVQDHMIDRLVAVMRLCPQHQFQVLTKRAARMREYFRASDRLNSINGAVWSLLGTPRGSKINHGGEWRATLPLANVWFGVSAEDQVAADERIPLLLDTPAAVRFVSLEPLLGPIQWLPSWDKLDWVIVGGESGPKARPMHPDWPRSIRDQCAAAGVPYFFKQWGALVARNISSSPEPNWHFERVGKKHAGRLLDGVEHNGMPQR